VNNLTIGVPIGAHKIYFGKRDEELEKWVNKMILERKFANMSHAVIAALTYLRRIEEPKPF